MKHWDKNKKDHQRVENRESHPHIQDHKKKKLKPVEKSKYKFRPSESEEDE